MNNLRVLVLSLNFRDERSVSGLDVVAVAKDYQGVVSEDLIWARIADEIAISACKFSASSMPYSDRYNM
jgi:hypothetical protein